MSTAEQPSPRYSDVETYAFDAAGQAMAKGGDAAAAAWAAIAAAQDFFDRIIPVLSLQPRIDDQECKAGCYYCCHQMVGVTVGELDLLARAVLALPASRQKPTRKRIARIARQGAGLTQGQWWDAKLRCPLLDEGGACLVHADRPLPCRAMNSASADLCRRSFGGETLTLPVLAAQHRVHGHAQRGLLAALTAAGHSGAVLALGTALALRLPPG